MEMEMEILSINIQTLTKIKYNVLLQNYAHVPIILLQELNINEAKQDLFRQILKGPWKLFQNKLVGILLHKRLTNNVLKTNRPGNGRSITLIFKNFSVTSIYAPTNSLSKPDFLARVLYTSIKGCTRTPTLLGGDFNCHLNQQDAYREYETGDIEGNIGLSNGVFRNFLLLTDLKVASDRQVTHEQKTVNGYMYSRKDYILKNEWVKTNNYEVIETTLSDHKLLRYTCHIDISTGASEHTATINEETVPRRLKDNLRKWSENKNEFLTLYTKQAWTERVNNLLTKSMQTKSLYMKTLNSGKTKLAWTNPGEAYKNVEMFHESSSMKQHFTLGKCYYRVQQIQDGMAMPSNMEERSLYENVEWIHHALKTSLNQVVDYPKKKNHNMKEYKSGDIEYKKWCYYSRMVQLITKALYFKDQTQQKRRLFGLIRQECPTVSLHRISQARRLLQYFKRQKQNKENWLNSQRFRRRKRTENLLQKTSFKKVIDDVFDKNADFEANGDDQSEQVDIVEQEKQIADKIKNWVAPMTTSEPNIKIQEDNKDVEEDAPITQLKKWALRNNLVQSQAIVNALERKNINCSWENISKTVTPEEIDSACKNRTSSPGYSRVTYRMFLYANTKIKQLIADVLTRILRTGIIPDNLKLGLIRPIPKQTGIPVEKECRPIILLEAMWKTLTIILSRRIQNELAKNQVLLPSAHGFLSNKRLSTPILIKQLVEDHARSTGRSLVSTELDVSKAYDFTRKHVLVAAMDRLRFPANILTLVDSMTTDTENKILMGNRVIGTSVLSTLRQGDPFSCILFVAQLDILLSVMDEVSAGYRLEKNRITCLAYADDISSLHETGEDAQNTISICDEFFKMHEQQINPQKSCIRHVNIAPQEIRIYGRQLPVLQGSDSSRYLGVWLQPSGQIQTNRSKIYELFARFRNLMKTNLSSVHLKARIVNSVLFPKLNHIVGKTLWRQHDLDKFEKLMKSLISKDADPNIIFGRTEEGGMGIWSPKIQGMTTLLKSVMSHINRNSEVNTAWQLLESSYEIGDNQLGWRTRHSYISMWTYHLMEELLVGEARFLNTCRNPLSIPVISFEKSKNESMGFVRTLREYLTSLKLLAEDNHRSRSIPYLQDLYDILPVKQAYNKAVVHTGWADRNLVKLEEWPGYRIPPSVTTEGWMVSENCDDPNVLLEGYARPVRLPENQELKYGKVVAYDLVNIVLGEHSGTFPKLGILRGVGTEMVQVVPVQWQNTREDINSEHEYEEYVAHVMTEMVPIKRNLVVQYSLANAKRTALGWKVSINSYWWRRDRNILKMEVLRRMHQEAHSLFDEPALISRVSSPILDAYTDGSLTRHKEVVHMGAAAVIRGPWDSMLGEYATSIPPIHLQLIRKPPGTTKPETIGAALAVWVVYSRFKTKCNLFIDNIAVVQALHERNFEKLIGFDVHAGKLLEELDRCNAIQNVTWVKSHQRSKTRESLANSQADELAEAARRNARIQGSYLSLPKLPAEELQILPMKDGGDFHLPYFRSKHIEIPNSVAPDVDIGIQGYTTEQILNLQQCWTYQPPINGVTSIEDSPTEPSMTAMSLRIKSGLGTLTMQQLVERPDLFGRAPSCPACGTDNVFSSSYSGWKHILFACGDSTIKSTAQKYIRAADASATYTNRNKWDKAMLTEVDSTQDYYEQLQACKKCIIPRMALNRKAGRGRAQSSSTETYRLDLYYYLRKKHDLFTLWKNILENHGLTLNIQILECVMSILREKDSEVYVSNLEPIHIGPSIWIKPKNIDALTADHGIGAINWFPILAFSCALCWWNEDVACGNICKHREYLPTGAVLYVRRIDALPLNRLQQLWQLCYQGQGNTSESKKSGIWINGSNVQQLIQDVPGIHISERYADIWTSMDSSIPYHATHWWLQRSMSDVIRWYQGTLNQSLVMKENLEKFARFSQRVERRFKRKFKEWCKTEDVTSQVLWDRKYLREYQKNPGRVKPYIHLTEEQKGAYQKILARNRRLMASNQKSIPIHKNLPRDQEVNDSL